MAEWGRPAPENLDDEPGMLAEAARLHLRERFLATRVGISGANFVVAETGTLVVLESEGNGRMCLTLPETLISVVGIEKVLPTWRDLEVFLQLLPRISTGERMNPYTSMWTGATARATDFHLVLLDNGRTKVLADEVGRQALRCIRCSACLNVCPVYERVGGHAYGSVYPGPIGAILTPQLRGIGLRYRRVAAVRVQSLRRVLRRVPGARSTSRKSSSTCGPRPRTPSRSADGPEGRGMGARQAGAAGAGPAAGLPVPWAGAEETAAGSWCRVDRHT